jgi:WS/DGAT/MGAT family acyltransferase
MVTNDDTGASWGGGPDMSAWEAMMWRAEGDYRTRSTGVVVELLDTEPDWDRLVAAHQRLVERVPRLKERVVEPTLPLVAPVWSPDPNFELDYHLQRVGLPGNGTMAELEHLAAQFASRPLDPQRPPWEALLVDGLEGGRSAYLFKPHHSLSDGLGLLQLLDLAHGYDRGPGPRGEPPQRTPRRTETSSGLLANRLITKLSHAPLATARTVTRTTKHVASDPLGAMMSTFGFANSLRRVLASPSAEHSPAFRESGSGYRLMTCDVALADLKASAQAAGGSVNDAFLAGLLGGFRLYHEKLGYSVDVLPMAIPISLRTDKDPMGGNRFAGARFMAPVGEPDPRARVAAIHRFISDARMEPALGFLDVIAPVLSRLPGDLLTLIASEMTGTSDIQASNLGAIARPLYLAGARVTHIYPMGPRPGIAAMVTMLSYDGTCCIAVNYDPDAITDAAAFADCMRAGFLEMIAIA